MAQALRTVWLEPEEQLQTPSPALPPRRRARPQPLARRGSGAVILCVVALVAAIVCLVGDYIHTHARIAQYEFERQALSTRLHLLQAESDQLKLDIAGLENATQVAMVAQQQSMVFPTADRVQYIQVAETFPPVATEQAAAPIAHHSWIARAGHLLVTRLDNIMQRFGHGPGAPAYAQE